MITEIVERVARAIWEVERASVTGPPEWEMLGEWAQGKYCDRARAAIRALDSPTEEMIQAIVAILKTTDRGLGSFDGLARAIVKAMLTAALGEDR